MMARMLFAILLALWTASAVPASLRTLPGASLTPGEVLNSFPNPDDVRGLTFKEGSLWGLTEIGLMYEMDPDDGTVLSFFSLVATGDWFGLGWDDLRGNFIVTNFTTQRIQRRGTSGQIVASFPSPGPGPLGAAYDSTRDGYWITDGLLDTLFLIHPDTGAVMASLPAPAGASRLQGTGYDARDDALMFHSKDSAETFLVRARDGALLGVFPIAAGGSNNGQGAAIRPSDRTGYYSHLEQPLIFVIGLFGTAAVPALSTWGLAGLCVLLLGAGCWVLSRRRCSVLR